MNLLLIAIMNLSVGFLAGVLAIPLITGGVGQNGSYGFRFKTSFQSDEAWYAINAYGGKCILFWSLVVLGTGVVFLLAYFIDLIRLSDGLRIVGVFAPCLLLISGIQASIWGDKRFPRHEAERGGASNPDTPRVEN